MVSQKVEFAIAIRDGVVVQIGKTFFYHPEIKFAGASIHWLEDKIRKEERCERI